MAKCVCDLCWCYDYLCPVAVHRAWWNPARWFFGRTRLIDCCSECAWEMKWHRSHDSRGQMGERGNG